MKSSIPTPYVLIAFRKDVIEKFIQNNDFINSLDLMETLKSYSGDKEDFLLFQNYANPNFVSLQHSLGAGGQSTNTIELEIIDPNNEFERRVIGSSFYPENVPFKLVDSSGAAVTISDSQKLDKTIRKDLYFNSIKNYVNSNSQRQYYIAYGVGPNLNFWAGPFTCELLRVEIDSTQFKKLKCFFAVPAGASSQEAKNMFINSENSVNLNGLKRQVNGVSKPLKFKEYIDGTSDLFYDPQGTAKKQSEEIGKIKNELDKSSFQIDKNAERNLDTITAYLKLFDYHTLVVDCIKNYISKVTGNNNVVVLLPNLNILLASSPALVDSIYSRSAKANNKFADIRDAGETKLQTALIFRESLSNLLGFMESMHQTIYNKYSDPLKQDFEKDQTVDAKEVSWITAFETHANKVEKLKSFFNENNFYASLDTLVQDNNSIDHFKLLESLIHEINRYSGSYIITPELIYENNYKILKIWETLYTSKDPAFNFEGSFSDTVIVFGDRDMIKKYMYAGDPIPNSKNDLTDTKISISLKGKTLKLTEQEKNSISQFKGTKDDIAKAKTDLEKSVAARTSFTTPVTLYHPTDKVFFTAKYNKDIENILYPDSVDAPFGSISTPPDEFAYLDTSYFDKFGSVLKRYPIFKYNLANPNVLGISIDINTLYLSELKTGFQKELFKSATSKLAGAYSDDYKLNTFLSEEAVISYIQNKLKSTEPINKDEVIQIVAESLNANGFPDGVSGDAVTIAKNCFALAEEGMNSKNRQTIIIDAVSPKNPATIMADLSNQLYKKSTSATIKTLPMFHISSYGHIQSPCLFFAQTGKIMKTNLDFDKDPFTTFISGLWNIIGFKHIITESDMRSEFTIIRNQKAIIDNKKDK
jgi:hypothetical protein